MGRLTCPPVGKSIQLPAASLIGRTRFCVLRLDDLTISAQHARIRWSEGRWFVRDLGSIHGTRVNGAPINVGVDVPIVCGDSLGFGAIQGFTLVDDSAPRLIAHRLDDGEIIEATDDGLVLPSPGDPQLRVLLDEHGHYQIEQQGQRTPVGADGLIELAGSVYILHSPTALSPTAGKQRAGSRLADIELVLRVSQDEEHVDVQIRKPNEAPTLLSTRAHYYTLLTLVRARLQDNENALPEYDCGWRSVDRLCEQLKVDDTRLNVDVYRIRRDFAAAGLLDATEVIERNRPRRTVRIASLKVSVMTV